MPRDETWTGDRTIAATLSEHDEALRDDGRPTRLGRYLLLQRLGAGGMGVVFAAYDEKLDRKVAIKLLRSRGSEQAQLRLVREAQALARLSHPNVVQIYEIAEVASPDGEQAYLVMEFIDGQTLGRWLAERPRSHAEILAVFVAAGRGLAAAHAAGLVHRDFKPDNVMIRSDGRVLVMDFGLAFAEASSAISTTGNFGPEREGDTESNRLGEQLTATGALMGTPAYMAPEQFLSLATDAQTDQFGFCVALWEALHGARPFAGRDLTAISLAVTQGRITRPERDEVPTWLREVIERGLAREPGDRWPSMHALLDALSHDPTRRRRIALFGIGTAALLIAAVAGVAVADRHERAAVIAACEAEGRAIADDWNDEIRAELERAFAATELEFADSAWRSTRGWLDAHVAQWTELRTRVCMDARVEATLAEDDYQRAIDCFDERRATLAGLTRAWADVDRSTIIRAPVAAAGLPSLTTCTDPTALARQRRPPDESREQVAALRARIEQADAHEQLGSYALALAQTEAILADAEQLGWAPLIVEARVRVGLLQDQAGRTDLAAATLQRAALDGVACAHDEAALDAVVGLTTIVGAHQAQLEQGLVWAELGLRLITRLELAGTLAEAAVLNARSGVHAIAGHIDDALTDDRRALAIRETVLGSDHVEVATSLDNIATLLGDKGEYDEALAMYERALGIRERALGPDHPDVSQTQNGIGGVHMARGEFDEALRHFHRAKQLMEGALGPDHVELAPSCNNIGIIHWQRGEYAEALVAFRRAQANLEAALGPEHPRVATTLDNIGNVLVGQGAYEEALAMHRRTLAIREAALSPDHVEIAGSLNNLATVLVELGRDDEALPAFVRARDILVANLGPEHPHVALAMINIADVHNRRGEHSEALALHERALAILEAALGPDNIYLPYSLVGGARARIGLGRVELARRDLERALAIRERESVPPAELAEIRFELAKLDWDAGNSKSARELAAAARDGFAAAGKAGERELAEVDAWLHAHK